MSGTLPFKIILHHSMLFTLLRSSDSFSAEELVFNSSNNNNRIYIQMLNVYTEYYKGQALGCVGFFNGSLDR